MAEHYLLLFSLSTFGDFKFDPALKIARAKDDERFDEEYKFAIRQRNKKPTS